MGFLGGSVGEESSKMLDTWDVCLISGSGRFPGGSNGNPLQYCCLENPMDKGAWWTTVHKAARVRYSWSNWAQWAFGGRRALLFVECGYWLCWAINYLKNIKLAKNKPTDIIKREQIEKIQKFRSFKVERTTCLKR